MNPSSNETSGLNLPPPVGEQAPALGAAGSSAGAAFERAPVPAGPIEKAPAKGQAMPAAAIPIPLPAVPAPSTPAPTQSDVNATSKSSATPTTDDDLIEKEWVNKAKRIIDNTRDDPYKQNEELTLVKADYMKKRYDKAIKLNK